MDPAKGALPLSAPSRSFPLPVILNRLTVALCVFILGMIRPSRLSQVELSAFLRRPPAPLLVSPPASFPPAAAVAFPPFCLAESDAPLLTIGNEKALPSYLAQHALSLHLLSKALE